MAQQLHRRKFIGASAAAAGVIAATALPRAVRAASWPIIDVQVHAYERNHPGRPWAGTLVGPTEMTGDQMVVAMDAVGVDGAVLVSPFSMYRYDASYALEVGAKHPNRFCLVKPVDPNDPAVADIVADWKAKKGTVGRSLSILRSSRSGGICRDLEGANDDNFAAAETPPTLPRRGDQGGVGHTAP
jgi:predicted TIM-barrel fold metal-dependent hydrolase